MEILLISSQFPPAPGGGGAYTHYLMNSLVSLQTPKGNLTNEIHVLTAGNENPTVQRLKPNLHIHRGHFSREGRVPYEAIVKYGLQLCRNIHPRVIHGQHFEGVYVAAQLKAAFPEAISFATFHQSPSGECLQGIERQDPRVAAMIASVPQMDGLVVTCPVYRGEMIDFGVAPEKVELIWPGINYASIITLAGGRRREALQELRKLGINLSSHDHLILCPARLDPSKDLETFIRAAGLVKKRFRGSKKFAFLIAGKSATPSERERIYEAQLRNIADSEGVTPDLWIAAFSLNDMFAIYKMSSACVLPSVREALGLVLIEAMALRVPLVVTNVPGMSDVVSPDVNSLVFPPRDHTQLADQLERLLTDHDLADRLRDMGVQTVKGRFNHKRMGKLHHGLYKKILRLYH